MNEAEWQTCTEPWRMLGSLNARWAAAVRRGEKVNSERLRLFACACCRRLWDLLDEPDREALAMIEGYARTGGGDLRAARRVHARARIEDDPPGAGEATQLTTWAKRNAYSAVWQAAQTRPTKATSAHASCTIAAGSLERARTLLATVGDRPPAGPIDWGRFSPAETAFQADLLRDVVGNPFRPAALDPAWLAANDGAVVQLARAIDSDRAYDRLPILGDALEEAGCADAEILSHCRGPGPHALGCWAVDLVLGGR
jgi:hypothetical protein